MRLYDISLPVHPGLANWPGDVPYQYTLSAAQTDGESVNVGAIRTSVHTGTHVDAPFHFDMHARGVDQLGLEAFVGPARVVDVVGIDPVTPRSLAGLESAPTPRLLLRTGAWPDHSRFPERLPSLHPELPSYLAAHGVVLLGVDMPSVDALDSGDLPVHHALNEAGIQILESLSLHRVPEGDYELIALPLRLVGADGSPVRAILRTI